VDTWAIVNNAAINIGVHTSFQISVFVFFFLKILFLYLTERDTAREATQAGGVGEGEAGFPPSREPDVGLDPRTLGS